MASVFAPDTDIFTYLIGSGRAEALAALGEQPTVVTDTVWGECETPTEGVGASEAAARVALATTWAGAKTVLKPATPEGATAATLMSQGDLEVGEVSILAWAYHHQDVVPVLHERHALFRAVEELPFRTILSFHGFLRVLRDGGLSKADADAISKWYRDRLTWKNSSRPSAPLWW